MALDRIQFENWVPKLVDYLKDNHIVDDEKIKAIEEEIENLRNDESKSLTAEYYEPVISNIVKMVLPVELFNVGTTTFDDSIKTIVHNYMTQEISETSSASVVDMPVTKALFGLFDVSTLNTILKVDKDFVAPKEGEKADDGTDLRIVKGKEILSNIKAIQAEENKRRSNLDTVIESNQPKEGASETEINSAKQFNDDVYAIEISLNSAVELVTKSQMLKLCQMYQKELSEIYEYNYEVKGHDGTISTDINVDHFVADYGMSRADALILVREMMGVYTSNKAFEEQRTKVENSVEAKRESVRLEQAEKKLIKDETLIDKVKQTVLDYSNGSLENPNIDNIVNSVNRALQTKMFGDTPLTEEQIILLEQFQTNYSYIQDDIHTMEHLRDDPSLISDQIQLEKTGEAKISARIDEKNKQLETIDKSTPEGIKLTNEINLLENTRDELKALCDICLTDIVHEYDCKLRKQEVENDKPSRLDNAIAILAKGDKEYGQILRDELNDIFEKDDDYKKERAQVKDAIAKQQKLELKERKKEERIANREKRAALKKERESAKAEAFLASLPSSINPKYTAKACAKLLAEYAAWKKQYDARCNLVRDKAPKEECDKEEEQRDKNEKIQGALVNIKFDLTNEIIDNTFPTLDRDIRDLKRKEEASKTEGNPPFTEEDKQRLTQLQSVKDSQKITRLANGGTKESQQSSGLVYMDNKLTKRGSARLDIEIDSHLTKLPTLGRAVTRQAYREASKGSKDITDALNIIYEETNGKTLPSSYEELEQFTDSPEYKSLPDDKKEVFERIKKKKKVLTETKVASAESNLGTSTIKEIKSAQTRADRNVDNTLNKSDYIVKPTSPAPATPASTEPSHEGKGMGE